MKHKTPGDLVFVPGHAGPAHPAKDEIRKNGNHMSGKHKSKTGYQASCGVRFPCYGLSLACSVYRTVDQLGDAK